MRRPGLQADLLFGLAAIMVLATVVLTAVLVTHEESRLRDVLGRALLVEAHAPLPLGRVTIPGTRWWIVDASGDVSVRHGVGHRLDAETRALADRARADGGALLQPGALWQTIRFATPIDARGSVAVARLPRAASVRLRVAPLWVAIGVLLADVVIFTAFGVYLLRRLLVQPLQTLLRGARAIAAGDLAARVPVQGSRETAELGHAFNAMTEALERRTGDLEKAVSDLRAANTDLRQARAGLDRAERLASVGRLAAGVAHEVGNPIAAMLAFLDLVGRDPRIGSSARENLQRAAREGERVGGILRQLLDFSRPSRGLPAPVDLVMVAREVVALVTAQRRYDRVALRVVPDAGTPLAWADPGAVTQILLNLTLNAADAVLGSESQKVELQLRPALLQVRAGEAREEAPARGRPDGLECLVCDTGSGIPLEDRERIFDPFYTTKPPGQGTGLGLSNALRIAEEQGGGVGLTDPPPGFTTAFALRLPTAGEPAAREPDEPSVGGRVEGSARNCGVRSRLRS